MRPVLLAVAALIVSGAFAQPSQPGFEVFSITRSDPKTVPSGLEPEDPCSQAMLRPTGRRVTGDTATLYAMVALAYNPWRQLGGGCAYARQSGLILGAPDWALTERYSVHALLPEGVASVSAVPWLTGEAPALQRLLQAALADRFRLALRRETREVPVYLLTLDRTAALARTRIAGSGDADRDRLARAMEGANTGSRTTAEGARYVSILFKTQSMPHLARRLSSAAQRPVVDRTDLAGHYDFILEYDDNGVARPVLVTALREQLGLRLQPARAPVEVLVVERAERPSAN